MTLHYRSASFTSVVIERSLRRLYPADMDATRRDECLPGTRSAIIQFVMQWVMNPSQQHSMLWVRGLAGSGKSTLSITLANELRRIGRLGAFLFFERDVTGRNDPSLVIRTLAYRAGLSHAPLGPAISAAVEQFPDISQFPLRSQFLHLLVQPLTSGDVIHPEKPLVFVLDALDECGNPEGRETLLELLAEQSNHLPILFLVMSRPVHDICGYFECRDHISVYELDISTQDTAEDIVLFLKDRMARIHRKTRSLRDKHSWPGDETIQVLADRASGLFVWASTACKFIDGYQPISRLDAITQGPSATTAQHALDVLYRTALGSAGHWDTPEFVADFRAILGFILVARQPLASETIISILGSSASEDCIDVISQLGCILQLNLTVRLLHPSFAEFLFDCERCIRQEWFFEATVLHQNVALLCLEHLNTVLSENVSNITRSRSLARAEVPEATIYACKYWVDHTSMVNKPTAIIVALDEFLRQHLLHWVEAMSLLQISRATIGMLERLYAWIYVSSSPFRFSDRV